MAVDSLWGDEFVLPKKEERIKKIIDKISEPKVLKTVSKEKVTRSKKISIDDKLAVITEEVYRVLGKHKDDTVVIRDRRSFSDYIDKAILKKRIAIDTETNNSLDPITCKLMGLCLFVDGEKQAYIPINHINRATNEKLENQLSEQDIKEELQRLKDNNVFVVMHNGKFDYSVIKCTCGICIPPDWDTLIGAKLLDENEKAGLKEQYVSKINPEQEKYSIEHLFQNIDYSIVDPDLFALYAATDAMMTDKLYQYQEIEFSKPDNERIYKLAKDLEMPLVEVIAEMELAGMEVDQEYADLLSKKYNNQLEKIDEQISEELEKIKPQIAAWKLTAEANQRPKNKKGDGEGKSKAEQLEDPINMGSPTQLAILFYDILGCPAVSKKSPRGTGEKELEAIGKILKLDLCSLLLERREVVKLISTYIETIPQLAKKWPDGRVRAHFNQYGADTGRLSSGGRIVFGIDDEWGGLNFQNIPSHNREIRMLFCSKPGYKIAGADFSAQEPRLTAFYSQDENMIKAYKEGRDLYAVIASMSFDRRYEDCLEFYPEGTVIDIEGQKITCGYKTHQNKEGKTYRNMAKSILLGVLYGRGAASVGEQIGKSREEAQEVIDKFFKAFPSVKKWIDKSISDAHKKGYVEDVAGRRRRLPDILLPKYEIIDHNENKESNFNPFLICEDRVIESKLVDIYKNKLDKIRSRKDYEKIQADALNDGIEIHDNNGFIAQAERQAVNSRVQGGAATLTKTALLSIYRDPELRKMGAYLINTVHDEILIETPDEYMKEAEKRLCDLMVSSAKDYVTNVPMACDGYVTNCWYLDEFNALVKDEFKKLLDDKHMDPIDAFEYMCEYRSESTRDQIYELVGQFLPRMPENVKIIHTLTD